MVTAVYSLSLLHWPGPAVSVPPCPVSLGLCQFWDPSASCQSLWASKVVSLTLPSMEAVRQVPQSMAVLQSTVTTGAR